MKVIAKLNGTVVYTRVLKGYRTREGLKLAIKNTLEDFKGFECAVVIA